VNYGLERVDSQPERRKRIMKDYEVADLFEAGNAGQTIQAKMTTTPDEVSGLFGPESEAFEEE
jgi:hypothetical protein